jgi:uroporphyrinogen decarboxylase
MNFDKMIDTYIKPVRSSSDVSSRDLVKRTITFQSPTYIPYSFIEPMESDFCESVAIWVLTGSATGKKREIGSTYRDEWGVVHKVTGRTWDHAVEHPLQNLKQLKDYRWPEIPIWNKTDLGATYLKRAADNGKYVVGHDPVMMFERARSLMGFEELMMAPYTQPKELKCLIDGLANLTINVIHKWAQLECVDGFMTWEDWGLQSGLQMKIDAFREYYRPAYERIIQAVHDCGFHYIWHNCGRIEDMIPDMIEMGVDVLQLDQPQLMGHAFIAEHFGGKICFWNTVDIQWSPLPEISNENIRNEIAEMISIYNRFNGGFMARQYPQPLDIGLSSERCRLIAETFFEQGCK